MFFALAFENTENAEKEQLLVRFISDLCKVDPETISSALPRSITKKSRETCCITLVELNMKTENIPIRNNC